MPLSQADARRSVIYIGLVRPAAFGMQRRVLRWSHLVDACLQTLNFTGQSFQAPENREGLALGRHSLGHAAGSARTATSRMSIPHCRVPASASWRDVQQELALTLSIQVTPFRSHGRSISAARRVFWGSTVSIGDVTALSIVDHSRCRRPRAGRARGSRDRQHRTSGHAG